jgi:hypothetical protein
MASFGDVHLHHPKTPTVHVLENLYKAFPDTPETGELDIIWLEGDLFDGLMNLPDPNVVEIRMWINYFLRLCKKRDIVLRVLEGTPSHDWKQSRLFVSINEIAQIGADVAFVETLSIEYIERFGISVLYVPDEWEPEPDDTWKQVQQLLVEHGLEKVDFSIMHGAFNYQLPSHVQAPTHSEDRYLDITRHYIFIGHVHRHSVYKRIIAAGSFDRICHGEEEPKGHVRVTVKKTGDEIVFVPTDNSKIYKTVTCTGLEVDAALKKVSKEIEHLPDGSYVRVEAGKTDTVLVSVDELRMKYPQFVFSTKVDKDTVVSNETLINLRNNYQPIAITRGNIKKLLIDRLQQDGQETRILQRAEELLDEYIAAGR